MASEADIVRRIERIKVELAHLGDLRPGTLSMHYNVCGTPNCRCKAEPPKKHGPYYHLSYTRHGKSRSEAVHPEHLAQVRAQTRNYQKLQDLLDQWLDASIELDRLRRLVNSPAPRSRRTTGSALHSKASLRGSDSPPGLLANPQNTRLS